MGRRMLVLGLAVALVGLGFAPVMASADPRKAKRAMSFTTRGERALETGNVDKATQQFRKALDTVPDFPPALIGLGHALMAQGEFEQALESYRASIESYGLLGDVMRDVQAQRYANAQDQIRSLQDSLNNYRQNSGSGLVNLEASKVENTIERLRAIEPPSSEDEKVEAPGEVYFHIGNALFRLGRLDAAIESWVECARRSPEFAMVHNNLAVAYFQRGEVQSARDSLARAEALGFPVHPQFKADLEKASLGS